MVRFTPERQRSVRFLSSFCVSCAPPSLPEVGSVFFYRTNPFEQAPAVCDRTAWLTAGGRPVRFDPCARRVRPTRMALLKPTCPACPARTVQFGVRFADSARPVQPARLGPTCRSAVRPVSCYPSRFVRHVRLSSACSFRRFGSAYPVCRYVRPSVCPRSLSVPFSEQKNRATGTNVLGTARFLEPSDRRNSLPQNPGHVKSRRISHSDSALLLHCFRIASRIPIPRRLTARFSHFLKNGAVKKPTFSG